MSAEAALRTCGFLVAANQNLLIILQGHTCPQVKQIAPTNSQLALSNVTIRPHKVVEVEVKTTNKTKLYSLVENEVTLWTTERS